MTTRPGQMQRFGVRGFGTSGECKSVEQSVLQGAPAAAVPAVEDGRGERHPINATLVELCVRHRCDLVWPNIKFVGPAATPTATTDKPVSNTQPTT